MVPRKPNAKCIYLVGYDALNVLHEHEQRMDQPRQKRLSALHRELRFKLPPTPASDVRRDYLNNQHLSIEGVLHSSFQLGHKRSFVGTPTLDRH